MAGFVGAAAVAALSMDEETERRGSFELSVLESDAVSSASRTLSSGAAQQLQDEMDSMYRTQREEADMDMESQVTQTTAPAASYSAASAKNSSQFLTPAKVPAKVAAAMQARSGASPMPQSLASPMSPSDPDLQTKLAVLQYSCSIRGEVADDLRETGERWESVSWDRRLELVRTKHAKTHVYTSELASPPPATPARRREIMALYKRLAKSALMQSRVQDIARHQTWWLISGSKRWATQKELHKELRALTILQYFAPFSKNSRINELPWYIIDPSGSFSVAWTFCMTLLLLYCMFTIPYFIAFDQSEAFRWTDVSIDCMFLLDIVFNFVTATIKSDQELQYQLEIRPRVLGKQYLRGWLLLDVLGTVPFTEIMRDSVQGADTYPRLIKVLRILRMLKLLRLSRFGQKADFVKSLLKMHVGIFRGIKFFVFFITLAHTMANILVITASFASDEHAHPKSWLTQFSVFNEGVGMVPISESSMGTQYVRASLWQWVAVTRRAGT
jgi:hypothetical protein